jgi:acylphosphatase
MNDVTKAIRVTGRVQGVGFRAWTRDRARRLHLDGWVRNEADGSVTSLVSGDAEQVARMLAELRDGPIGSSVEDVAVEDAAAPSSAGFEIR